MPWPVSDEASCCFSHTTASRQLVKGSFNYLSLHTVCVWRWRWLHMVCVPRHNSLLSRPAPPAPNPPHPPKQKTHFLMSILCRGFISKNKQMTANQSFFAEDRCFRRGMVSFSCHLLLSLVWLLVCLIGYGCCLVRVCWQHPSFSNQHKILVV